MILPALSVREPWANLIAQRSKSIETRTWATRYRGPLVICSSLAPRDQGPAGYALCVTMLKACAPMMAADWELARCAEYAGAIGWRLGKIWPLYQFRVRGQRGLFAATVPAESFPDPQDRHEVQTALEWAQRHDLLKYVHGF
jgi:hypothetical protein